MSAECSRSSLEIPRKVVSILASIVGGLHSQPVWTFARHGNGYSLKLFWKAEFAAPLNNAHSTNSGRMNRNRRRMEAFLSKKTSLSERVNVGTNGTPGPSFLSSSEAKLTHTQCLSTSTSSPAETESQHPTLSVTKHHVDFVKCDDVDTANAVKKCMEQQWSTLVKPGRVVKVKVKDELVPAVVKTHISSQSYLLTVSTFSLQPRLTLD